MADIFIEGFDKYGPASTNSAANVAALTNGEWTGSVLFNTGGFGNYSPNFTLVSGLSATGCALQIAQSYFGSGSSTSAPQGISKTLPGNASRLVGGMRFQSPLSILGGVTFSDGSNAQASVVILTTGKIAVYGGSITGTALGTSTASVSANATHYLEWDITFGPSASYALYLDGISILSGTGNTRAGSSNSYANVMQVVIDASPSGSYSASAFTIDDLYLFDTTGSLNNAVLLTSPRVETQFPTSDSAVQFSPVANVLGSDYTATTSTNAPGSNEIFLRSFTPAVNMTLNSVSCVPGATSSGANFKAVLYSNSGTAPQTLVATGAAVTGATSGTTLTSAFGSGQALTAGTPYWIGFITDTSVALQQVDATATGVKASNTYTSGAPGTAPTMTTAQPSWQIWGNCSGAAANYVAENVNPPPGTASYVQASTVGNTDLYAFPALTMPPAAIYTVAVKAVVAKTDSGSRTVSMVTKSSGTSGNGSAAGQTPGTNFAWMDSFFDTDPNTSTAWTASGLNAATSGVTIAS